MVPASDITVLLCHGGFLTPAHYADFLHTLEANGIETTCPHLPSSDFSKLNVGDDTRPDFDREPPNGGYPRGEDDVDAVLDVLLPRIDKGQTVIMIGHSAGGWVATQASRPDLHLKHRRTKGLKGGIAGLFYVGAYIVPVGESILSLSQPADGPAKPPPFLQYYKHGPAGLSTIINPEKLLFNDLSDSEAASAAAGMTAGTGLSLASTLTNDAYATLPCAYVVLENDQVLPREMQEAMVAMQAQKTGNFTVYHCPSGHSPQLSRTRELVDLFQDFCQNVIV